MSGIAERLAEVVEAIIVDHDMWIGDKGEPLEYLPEREARIAAFVDEVAQALLPVVEREIAAARGEIVARVEAVLSTKAEAYGRHLISADEIRAALSPNPDRGEGEGA